MNLCNWITNPKGWFLVCPKRAIPLAAIMPYAYQPGFEIIFTRVAYGNSTEIAESSATNVEDAKRIVERVITSTGWIILTEEQMNLI